MLDPVDLETAYQGYILNLKRFLPDGIIDVNLPFLQELGLLDSTDLDKEDQLTHQFYVYESQEKLTLFNHIYIVWIVPQIIDSIPSTYTLIAHNIEGKPQLEAAFSTSGVYNHSHLVLRILEKFLNEIEENERSLPF